MKLIVKATYTTYARIEVDAKDVDEANMELDKRAKHCPNDFMDAWKSELDDYELYEIVEGYKYVR